MNGPAVVAKITAKPGRRDDLVAALREMLAHAETEPGTLEYKLHTDRADADVVWFYERYDSDEALAAHGTSDTMKRVGAGTRDLAAGRPEIFVLDVVGGKGF